jgi:hypothetical protein
MGPSLFPARGAVEHARVCVVQLWRRLLNERDVTIRVVAAYACLCSGLSLLSSAFNIDLFRAVLFDAPEVEAGAYRLWYLSGCYLLGRVFLLVQEREENR